MHPSHTTTTTSRLRRGGLTCTVVAAAVAAVAASTALVTANAAVIYSGVVNTTASSLVSNPNRIPINLDSSGAAEFSLVASNNGKGAIDSIGSFANGFMPIGNPMNAKITKFTLGYQVDATGAFSALTPSGGVGNFYSGESPGFFAWAANDDGYFGFTFNPTGGTPLYGWADIATSANGTTVTLVDYAYENAGASILTGEGRPVPEPSTTVLGSLGLLGLAACFRQHRRRTAAQA